MCRFRPANARHILQKPIVCTADIRTQERVERFTMRIRLEQSRTGCRSEVRRPTSRVLLSGPGTFRRGRRNFKISRPGVSGTHILDLTVISAFGNAEDNLGQKSQLLTGGTATRPSLELGAWSTISSTDGSGHLPFSLKRKNLYCRLVSWHSTNGSRCTASKHVMSDPAAPRERKLVPPVRVTPNSEGIQCRSTTASLTHQELIFGRRSTE